MGIKYAEGRKAWGECERCGLRFLLNDLINDGHKQDLLVCQPCWDMDHPQENLPEVVDPITLYEPTGDLDAAAARTIAESLSISLSQPSITAVDTPIEISLLNSKPPVALSAHPANDLGGLTVVLEGGNLSVTGQADPGSEISGDITVTAMDSMGQEATVTVAVQVSIPAAPSLSWSVLSSTGLDSSYGIAAADFPQLGSPMIAVVGSFGGRAAAVYSDDGCQTWSAPIQLSSTSGTYCRFVEFGNGFFMTSHRDLYANSNGLHRSPDGGISWQSIALPPQHTRGMRVFFGDGHHIVVGEGGGSSFDLGRSLSYTPDAGDTWTVSIEDPHAALGLPGGIEAAESGGGVHLIAASNSSRAPLYSLDRVNWQLRDSFDESDGKLWGLDYIDWDGETFVAVGLGSASGEGSFGYSPDGRNWFMKEQFTPYPDWDPSMADPDSFQYNVRSDDSRPGWRISGGSQGRLFWAFDGLWNHTNLDSILGEGSTTFYDTMISRGRAYALSLNGTVAIADLPEDPYA